MHIPQARDNRSMRNQYKPRKHRLSVSATELAKLGFCELMVALSIADAQTPEMQASSELGEREHERYHLRSVLNAGSDSLVRELRATSPAKGPN